MTQKTNPSDDQIHPIAKYFLWLDKPLARKLPLVIFGVLTLLFLSYDFIVHRHGYTDMENTMGFYVLVGFFGFSLAVLCGWPLRWLLSRAPNYYEKAAGDE